MTTALAPAATSAALLHYLGVSESPAGSNRQQFSTCCGRPPEAWCADFQCCVAHRDLGFEFSVYGLPEWGTAGCSVFVGAMKRVGLFTFFPRVHAYVFFGPGGGSHIEYVIALVLDDGQVWTSTEPIPAGRRIVALDTVGGNTSAPNNYAGGTVARHRRVLGSGDDIYGYGLIPVATTPTPAPPEEPDMRPFIVKLPNDATAYLVGAVNPVTGKLIGLQMTDANDLRNPPDGYGPVVEVTQASMDAHVEH